MTKSRVIANEINSKVLVAIQSRWNRYRDDTIAAAHNRGDKIVAQEKAPLYAPCESSTFVVGETHRCLKQAASHSLFRHDVTMSSAPLP